MIKRLKISKHAYFITTRLANGLTIFCDDKCCEILLNDLNYYRDKLDYLIYGYVIMPDHFHCIIHPGDKFDVSEIMNKIKGHSSFSINKYLGRSGPIWQKSFHDHVIRNGRDLEEKINYIHQNPFNADLVDDLSGCKYSSYRNYYLGDESLIKIDVPNYSVSAK